MNFVAVGDFTHLVITIGVFALMCAITYLFLISGEKLVSYIGENAVSVVTRMMGLILAVIGIQMLIEGIYGAVRAFSAPSVCRFSGADLQHPEMRIR